ncbi:hypothetical protein OF83DRAFT_1171375 [Amylostereum chailletii]|nr:hypothetical protein OF83DRAFT_1171375 [Amylostereum chailletii]
MDFIPHFRTYLNDNVASIFAILSSVRTLIIHGRCSRELAIPGDPFINVPLVSAMAASLGQTLHQFAFVGDPISLFTHSTFTTFTSSLTRLTVLVVPSTPFDPFKLHYPDLYPSLLMPTLTHLLPPFLGQSSALDTSTPHLVSVTLSGSLAGLIHFLVRSPLPTLSQITFTDIPTTGGATWEAWINAVAALPKLNTVRFMDDRLFRYLMAGSLSCKQLDEIPACIGKGYTPTHLQCHLWSLDEYDLENITRLLTLYTFPSTVARLTIPAMRTGEENQADKRDFPEIYMKDWTAEEGQAWADAFESLPEAVERIVSNPRLCRLSQSLSPRIHPPSSPSQPSNPQQPCVYLPSPSPSSSPQPHTRTPNPNRPPPTPRPSPPDGRSPSSPRAAPPGNSTHAPTTSPPPSPGAAHADVSVRIPDPTHVSHPCVWMSVAMPTPWYHRVFQR